MIEIVNDDLCNRLADKIDETISKFGEEIDENIYSSDFVEG